MRTKKMLFVILAAVMMLGLIPLSAFAVDYSEWTDTTTLPTSGTYKLMNDVTFAPESGYVLTLTGDLTLDLNGHKVIDKTNKDRYASTIIVPANTTFTIEDNSSGAAGSIEFSSTERIFDRRLIDIRGTLILKSGKIVNNTQRAYALFSSGGGRFEMSGGEIINTATSGYGIYFYGASYIDITGGKLTSSGSSGCTLHAMGSTIVNLSNCEVSKTQSSGYALELDGRAKLSIENCTISNTGSSGTALSMRGNVKATIVNSPISNTGSSGNALYMTNATYPLVLENCEISNTASSGKALFINTGAEVVLKSGTITDSSTSSSKAVFLNGAGSKFTMEGGSVISEGKGLAIDADGGDLLITGGLVRQNCNYSSSCAIDIGNSVNSATFAGGVIQSNTKGIQSYNKPITVTGGTINATYALHARNVTVDPAEGSTVEINASNAILYTLDGSCDIQLQGGDFNSDALMTAYTGEQLPSPVITGGEYDISPKEYVPDEGNIGVIKYTSDGEPVYFVGPEEIDNVAENAKAGDRIEVMQGDIDLIIAADNVQIVNSGDGDVTVNNEELQPNSDVYVTHSTELTAVALAAQKAKSAIDAMTNLSEEAKNALKREVDAAFETAKDNINAIVGDATTAKNNGITAIQAIVTRASAASDLNAGKATAIATINEEAEYKKAEIKAQSYLSAKQKATLYAQVDEEVEIAIANINAATTPEQVVEAMNLGISSIADNVTIPGRPLMLLSAVTQVKVVDAETESAIAGATFELFRYTASGKRVSVGTFTSNDNGKFTVRSMSPRFTYELVQLTAAEGYDILETPVTFRVRYNSPLYQTIAQVKTPVVEETPVEEVETPVEAETEPAA